MRSKLLLIISLVVCIYYSFSFPEQAHGAAFFSSPESLPSASFTDVTITEEVQNMPGGIGKIEVSGLLGGLLWEDWSVTVEASPFTNTLNGSILTLPIGSFQLITPTSNNTGCKIQAGGPWIIDDGQPKEIVNGRFAFLGLGSCTFNFNPSPFILTIYPNVKMIDPGNTTAAYQSTITWTLTSTGGV